MTETDVYDAQYKKQFNKAKQKAEKQNIKFLIPSPFTYVGGDPILGGTSVHEAYKLMK